MANPAAGAFFAHGCTIVTVGIAVSYRGSTRQSGYTYNVVAPDGITILSTRTISFIADTAQSVEAIRVAQEQAAAAAEGIV